MALVFLFGFSLNTQKKYQLQKETDPKYKSQSLKSEFHLLRSAHQLLKTRVIHTLVSKGLPNCMNCKGKVPGVSMTRLKMGP